MDKMETLVLAALKEKSPALHRQLADLGRLPDARALATLLVA